MNVYVVDLDLTSDSIGGFLKNKGFISEFVKTSLGGSFVAFPCSLMDGLMKEL